MNYVRVGDGDVITIATSVEGQIKIPVYVEVTHSPSEPEPDTSWYRDIRDELPRNDDCPGLLADGWWEREMSQIDGITIHHTLSHSPHATARHYLNKGGGRPSIPYHWWITQTGDILYCLDVREGCWHDHTGHKNTHISVGLAGSLHIHKPPDVQLDAAALCIARAAQQLELSIDDVRGHRDYFHTICPGWDHVNWKSLLYERIEERLSV